MEKPAENLPITSENLEKPIRNLGGRPKKDITSVMDSKVIKQIDSYINSNEDNITFASMGHLLGFSCALDFIEAAKKQKGPLAYALAKVESRYENELIGRYSTGAIFALKQVGWADTQKVETEVKAVTVNISLEASLDDLSKVLNPVVEVPAV